MKKASPLDAFRSGLARIDAATDKHREASAEHRAVAASCPRPEELTTTGELAKVEGEEEHPAPQN